jgi:hypothetical protein
MEGRWTINPERLTGVNGGSVILSVAYGPVAEVATPVVPCDDAAVERAVEWATHAGVKPMREFVEGIIAALADASPGCPCVGTPDQEDCPHG